MFFFSNIILFANNKIIIKYYDYDNACKLCLGTASMHRTY